MLRKTKTRMGLYGFHINRHERLNLFRKFDYYKLNPNGFELVREYTRPNIRPMVRRNEWCMGNKADLQWMYSTRNTPSHCRLHSYCIGRYTEMNKVFPYKPYFTRVA